MEVSLVASFLNCSKIVKNMLGNHHLVAHTHTPHPVTVFQEGFSCTNSGKSEQDQRTFLV